MKKEIKCYCGHTSYCDCGPETLEEAAVINYKKLYEGEPLTQDVPIDVFIDGAKWQQERMYSEEEVFKIVNDFCFDWNYNYKGELSQKEYLIEWFNKNKKI